MLTATGLFADYIVSGKAAFTDTVASCISDSFTANRNFFAAFLWYNGNKCKRKKFLRVLSHEPSIRLAPRRKDSSRPDVITSTCNSRYPVLLLFDACQTFVVPMSADVVQMSAEC